VIRLIRTELFKFFSTRMWWGLLIATTAASTLFAVIYAGFVAGSYDIPDLDDPGMVRMTYTAGISVTYLFTLAIGVMSMTGEYRHQTMTATALVTPRRYRIVMAKLSSVALIGLLFGVVAVLSGVLVTMAVALIRGYDILLFGDGIPRALGLAVLAVALWAVLGLGVGTMIRNQVLALFVSIGFAWLGESLISLLLLSLEMTSVAKFLPGMATAALVEPADLTGTTTQVVTYLPWWGAALVLFGYAAVAATIGSVLTVNRDID
jgi:hypothetical protein